MNIATKQQPSRRWSLGGVVQVDACPACGGLGRKGDGMVCNDPTISLKADLWDMQKCATCSSLYLDPKPDPDSLALAYREYETHSEEAPEGDVEKGSPVIWGLVVGYLNRRFKMARPRANRVGWFIFCLAVPWRLKLDYYCRHLYPEAFVGGKRLLDAGCGNGAFLAIAREMGWEVLGLDPDPIGIEMCHRKGIPAVQGTLAKLVCDHDGAFDVVTMSHSIEHVDDMRGELARVFRLLQPGGLIWIATPNPGSLGARWFGRAWRGLRPPYHLCIPSQQALVSLLRSNGFVDVRLIRRGVHSRRAFREVASNLQAIGMPASKSRAWLAPFVGVLSDLLATVSVKFSEETVITARKPVS